MFKDPYSLEMFRRALVEGDLQARQWVQHSYCKTVLDWLRNHPHKDEASRFYGEHYYVSQTFVRLWQLAAANPGLECNTLAAALQYLHMSLNSVLLDSLRPAARPENEGEKLWEILQALISDAREQRLAYLLYHCGLKPVEIVRACPQEFNDMQEVSRLRLNILERLLSNADAFGRRVGNEQLI